MRIYEIFDLLQECNVRMLEVQGVMPLLMARDAKSEEEVIAHVKSGMARSLVNSAAQAFEQSSDWNATTTDDGVRFTAQLYPLNKRKLFDLVRAAYMRGRRDANNERMISP